MTYTVPNTITNGTLADGSKVEENFTDIENEFNLVTTDSNMALSLPPIGAILPWAKTLTGVPALPANYHECDGSVLSDAGSPLNGQTLPNLNGTTDADKRFLRGATTSGGTGGTYQHNHGQAGGGEGSVDGAYSNANHIPTYYEVVFIIRIK